MTTKSKVRPCVFVGSSKEGKIIAKHIQVLLDESCEIVIWDQGPFGLSKGGLDSLHSATKKFDFAILVVTADDTIISRNQEMPVARDNVILEVGLFIGVLGPERTFLVCDKTKEPKLPTDLAGITLAKYTPHEDGNLEAALGAPCTKIENAINKLGLRESRAYSNINSEHYSKQELENKIYVQNLETKIAELESVGTLSIEDSVEQLDRIHYQIDGLTITLKELFYAMSERLAIGGWIEILELAIKQYLKDIYGKVNVNFQELSKYSGNFYLSKLIIMAVVDVKKTDTGNGDKYYLTAKGRIIAEKLYLEASVHQKHKDIKDLSTHNGIICKDANPLEKKVYIIDDVKRRHIASPAYLSNEEWKTLQRWPRGKLLLFDEGEQIHSKEKVREILEKYKRLHNIRLTGKK